MADAISKQFVARVISCMREEAGGRERSGTVYQPLSSAILRGGAAGSTTSRGTQQPFGGSQTPVKQQDVTTFVT